MSEPTTYQRQLALGDTHSGSVVDVAKVPGGPDIAVRLDAGNGMRVTAFFKPSEPKLKDLRYGDRVTVRGSGDLSDDNHLMIGDSKFV